VRPRLGDHVTLRCRLGDGHQYVDGVVLALFDDEVQSDLATTRVPWVRIRRDGETTEDVWEAPLVDVVRVRR